jgi:DNA modification methylase
LTKAISGQIGIEIEPNYCKIIQERFAGAENSFKENSNKTNSKNISDSNSKERTAKANQPTFW